MTMGNAQGKRLPIVIRTRPPAPAGEARFYPPGGVE
jgi:hypothetical protein